MPELAESLAAALRDRYRIERELGAGGMATVYLAEDLKHHRKVAIKVLHPELAAALGSERFLHEIRTTANLQHAHILALHDSGAADGFLFYVMPFVDGESLRDRLTRERQLPIPDAIRIAREVASALDYAHKRGVIHRDIKPENILLNDGAVLVADFGIALAVQQAGGQRMTQTGLSLGTPQYMAPEQALGEKTLDARADIYALGAVTYEMVTGEPPFTGATVQAIVAKVLTERPMAPSAVRDTVPPNVEVAVLTALAKLPADRWGSAKGFADALTSPVALTMAGTTASARTKAASRGRSAAAGWAVAAIALALAGWAWFGRPQPPIARPARVHVLFPRGQELSAQIFGQRFAFSDDGAHFAYVGVAPGNQRQLWVRARDALDARPVAGTLGAAAPVFSPDGVWLAFVANGKLRKVRVAGGDAVTIADSANNTLAGAAWLRDQTLVFTHQDWTLHRVSADGGASVHVAGIGHALALDFPHALPRNDAVLYTTCTDACDSMTVGVLNLRTGAMTELAGNATGAWYAPSGHVVYMRRDGVVHALPFDLDRLKALGPPVPMIERVMGKVVAEFAMASDGSVAYVEGNDAQSRRFVRVDRAGKDTLLDPQWPAADLESFALSPDGRQLAVTVKTGSRSDVWVKQLDRGPLTRLTVGGRRNARPAWSADGQHVSYVALDSGFSVQLRRRDGTGDITRFASPASLGELEDQTWSPDGRWLITTMRHVDDFDIRARSISGDSSFDVAAAKDFAETAPEVSPDGRWIAYGSNESGRPEVYVRSFPDVGRERLQVSTGGGYSPVWNPRGRELFYIDNSTRQLMAVPITTSSNIAFGAPRPLFPAAGYDTYWLFHVFAVAPDGQSFLFMRGVASETDPQMVMVFNWLEELKTKVPR
jgi:serine/threonine-protein kinase